MRTPNIIETIQIANGYHVGFGSDVVVLFAGISLQQRGKIV